MTKIARFLPRIAFVALLSATALHAQQPFQRGTEVKPEQPLAGETQALWNIYERAVIDSAVYQRWNVRPLRPLTPDEHGQVLAAMVTSKDGKVGDSLTAGTYGMWVTGVPEVQTLCRAFHGDVAMQLRELLGLPPDADVPTVLVLKVAVSDLFRPAPDDSTNTLLPCKPQPDASTPHRLRQRLPVDDDYLPLSMDGRRDPLPPRHPQRLPLDAPRLHVQLDPGSGSIWGVGVRDPGEREGGGCGEYDDGEVLRGAVTEF